jgi:hypothetical protein
LAKPDAAIGHGRSTLAAMMAGVDANQQEVPLTEGLDHAYV